jgi:flagellar biosynthesis chaperone FliJ
MAVSRALRRLLRIRDLEEEQCRLALESAIGDLSRLRHAQEASVERGRRGRRLVESSAHSGELTDRLAGLEETRAAGRSAVAIAPRVADAEQDVANLREEYLASRVERRQAETLIEEAEARDALDAERRAQQGLDDWFRNRLHRQASEAKLAKTDGPGIDAGRDGPEEIGVADQETRDPET